MLSTVLSVGVLVLTNASGDGQVKFGPWEKTSNGNYYRRCSFPAGGHQYLILVKDNPQWAFWFNPDTQVFWCACPTVRHPDFARDVKEGKKQFLMAIKKASALGQVEFPAEAGKNFKATARVKDKDGTTVELTPPPSDLPAGL